MMKILYHPNLHRTYHLLHRCYFHQIYFLSERHHSPHFFVLYLKFIEFKGPYNLLIYVCLAWSLPDREEKSERPYRITLALMVLFASWTENVSTQVVEVY
jgi:hypothetical protein